MKKLISIILALMMVVACFGTLSVSAATFTPDNDSIVNAYVCDGGAGNGTTAETPASSIASVLTTIHGDVGGSTKVKIFIQLVGTTTIDLSGDDVWLQGSFASGTTVTIMGQTKMETLILKGASGSTKSLCLQTITTFANINFKSTDGNVAIVACNGALTMGTTTGKPVSKDAESLGILVSGGMGSKAYSNVTLNSGTYDSVFATNYSPDTANASTHGATVTVNSGATVKTLATACVMTANDNKTHVVSGDVNIVIDDAKIEKLTFFDVTADRIWYAYSKKNLLQISGTTTVKIKGNADVTFAAATFNGNIDSTFFSVNDTAPTSGMGVQYKGGIVVDTSEYTGTDAVQMTKQLADVAKTNVAITQYNDNQLKCLGIQKNDKDDTTVRFLIGLREYEDATASVKIVAKDESGESIGVLTTDIHYVYTSVLAEDTDGNSTTITAESYGVNYLMAVKLTDIPADVDIKQFEVTPYINGVVGTTTTVDYIK